MIGLDSNVILRALIRDDPVQSAAARRLLASLSASNPGVLNSVVLVEIAWTLRRYYKLPAHEVVGRIEDLMRSEAYQVVDRSAVMQALEVSHEHSIEFADALIGELNRAVGCTTTMTFDQGAAQTPRFTELH